MINWEMWYHQINGNWFRAWGLSYPWVGVVVIFWIFAFGACIGSFLNVCIWRIPRGESLSKASSHCTVCGSPIRWYDNIPVISYLVLRGRCRSCRTPYSATYFMVELCCGVLAALLVLKTGLSGQSAEVIPARMLMIFFGVTCGMTDLRFRVVPDKLTFTGMFFALLSALVFPEAWSTGNRLAALCCCFVSGAIPGGVLAVFALLGRLLCRRDVIGWGDVKFVILCGMFLGLPGAVFSLFAGSFFGTYWGIAVERKLDAALPFVPFIVLGTWFWMFFDIPLLNFFVKLF